MENGQEVERETRGWNLTTKSTVSMRSKEESHDYRYFPEPDIPPVVLDSEYVEKIKNSLPELPDDRLRRFVNDYKLSEKDAWTLVEDKKIADFFEEVVKQTKEPKETANWFLTELFRMISEHGEDNIHINPTTFR